MIRSVRRRWRLRVALRGAAMVLAAGLVVYVVSSFGMDMLRFTPAAVIAFRVLTYATLAALIVRFLILPMLRRVSDERVALYLEEHEPSLEARLLSAVEFGGVAGATSGDFSPALVERLVQNAVQKCAEVDYGRRVETRTLTSSSGLLAGTTVAALALLFLAPPFVRHSTPYLLPWGGASLENPYRIDIEPGNARVPRGAELEITAQLRNFDSDQVEIAVKRGAEGEWERLPMTIEEETADYAVFLFGLEEETEYFVEASGVRSPLYRIEVVELPYVEELTLDYRFPAYSGLEPQRQEGDGDIAALRGTVVTISVLPTVGVAGGTVVFEDGAVLPLELSVDGVLTGSIEVTRDDMYRIVFETRDGDSVDGSPDYLIDVLSDQPPYIAFAKPGRDTKATSVEEVFVEVEAEDDYGIRLVELIYSVNGGPEQKLALYRGGRREVSAGHTFYLEEIELTPGDFISYYARASDDNRVSGRQVSTTDIYFLEIRPFEREYRQAEQAGGAGGGGAFDSSLSQRQREIISATFKLIRDRAGYSTEEYNENLATVTLAQGRLREQVEALVARISARGILQLDSTFEAIAEALPAAAAAMREAEESLGERDPEEALPPEQLALQQLQRAESAFREVQVGRGDPSGGGGGAQPDADELAELFELELDKQRNQYEQVQRDRQQQVDEQIDETLQKLQELARRQVQETERQRARSVQGQSRAGGGSQRQLAEEVEELARRLERLSREESRPELSRTARQLRQAAEEMRRASAGSRDAGLSEGISALERLREARRLLDQSRSVDLQRDVDDALRRAERLAAEQEDVQRDVERLSSSSTGQAERLRRLLERKEEMAEEVADLEAQLDRLSRESRRDQRDASRRLQEAARSIREDKLTEKILYSRGVIQQRSGEYAQNFEEQIAQDIERLTERIEAASDAVGESDEQRLARTLDEAHALTRSLESLQDRINRQAEGARSEAGESGQEAPAAVEPEADTSDGMPGMTAEATRQFRREFRERRSEAERLRQQLDRQGLDTDELQGIIRGLRRLENDADFGDPRGLAQLQAEVIQSLKDYEYVLRRRFGREGDRELLLMGSDEVPENYRDLVEAYYRSLAEEKSP
ncbi:MAG: hypothetical protein JSU87_07825 [Gemmatimonadota bacterium]|nr:MAG: hypothetical protein JSU87_07825 [Gemmatimonadota bacterium]